MRGRARARPLRAARRPAQRVPLDPIGRALFGRCLSPHPYPCPVVPSQLSRAKRWRMRDTFLICQTQAEIKPNKDVVDCDRPGGCSVDELEASPLQAPPFTPNNAARPAKQTHRVGPRGMSLRWAPQTREPIRGDRPAFLAAPRDNGHGGDARGRGALRGAQAQPEGDGGGQPRGEGGERAGLRVR